MNTNQRIDAVLKGDSGGCIVCGDWLEVAPTMPDGCVDAVVTDPPYGLKFMGKHWDCSVPSVLQWAEVLRVLKPGGHLLSFFGTRTYHRGVVNIEDAGFEIRDQIAWLYGSGFPKSHDVSKAIDKAAGVEREVGTPGPYSARRPRVHVPATNAYQDGVGNASSALITAPATPEAQQWDGWGTALKPAMEPIVVARKPLIGTVAANVLQHGTGGLNIDGCRIGIDPRFDDPRLGGKGDWSSAKMAKHVYEGGYAGVRVGSSPKGRWPANVIHDGSEEVVSLFPVTSSGKMKAGTRRAAQDQPDSVCYGTYGGDATAADTYADSGSAARFFYCAKASKAERNRGLEDMPNTVLARSCQAQAQAKRGRTVECEGGAFNKARITKNNHPTVKPMTLMRYLCRLVTPPDGIVLDCFCGSGSTLIAAKELGRRYIGIDISEEYCEIARQRIRAVETGVPVAEQRAGQAGLFG